MVVVISIRVILGLYEDNGKEHGHYYLSYMGGCQNYGPFWVPSTIRHLIFRVPKKGPSF